MLFLSSFLPLPPMLCPAPMQYTLVLPQYLCFPTDIFHLNPTQHCQVLPMLLTPSYLTSPSFFLGLICLPTTTVLLSLLTHAPAAAFRWLLCKLCRYNLASWPKQKAAEALTLFVPRCQWSSSKVYLQAFHLIGGFTQFSEQVHVMAGETAPLHVPYFFWKSSWTSWLKIEFISKEKD